MHLGKLLIATVGLAAFITGALSQKETQSGLVGEKKCAECHTSTVRHFAESVHALYVEKDGVHNCEACHGPGKQHSELVDGSHIIDFAKASARQVVDTCLKCHGDLMKKPHFANDVHGRAGLSCVNCHQIHPRPESSQDNKLYVAQKPSNPLLKADEATLCATCHKPELAAFRKNSHHPIPEGRMTCSDCHSIHPTNADRLKIGTVKEKCVTCHADIAGPFAFEHDPVAGWTGGGCMECHNPHGSQNPRLLRTASRGLCAQCHTDVGGASHYPGLSCWSSGCHVAVHGSNHDPRLLYK